MTIEEFYDYCWARGYTDMEADHVKDMLISFHDEESSDYSAYFKFDRDDYTAHREAAEVEMREYFAKIMRNK